MRLFTHARHRTLHCDAYVVDASRAVRTLAVEPALSLEQVVEACLERTLLMGRSLHGVRDETFAVFAGASGGAFTLALTAPCHAGALGALHDTLAAFGPVTEGRRETAAGLFPLLAYEAGRVSFFDSPDTRPWVRLAGRRGVRILAATTNVDPDPDVFFIEEIVP